MKDQAVPSKLMTVNSLKEQEMKPVIDAINPLVADAFALYVKTKNFHWHMSGPHFRDYHLLFDEQAEQIFEIIDVLAERIRKLGGLTIHSIGEIGRLQTIKDDNDSFVTPQDMVKRLMEDNKNFAANLRKAHKVCVECDEVATASFLEIYIDETERRTWFLFEVQAI